MSAVVLNITQLSFIILLLSIQLFFSCESDERIEICRPLSFKDYSDSIVFKYDGTTKVERLLYYAIGTQDVREDILEYNTQGQLIRVARFEGNPKANQNFELIYDNQGKPQQLRAWGEDTSAPPNVTTYSYDSKGRLQTREKEVTNDLLVYRYEYDNNDNVTRIFYKT